MDDKLFLSFLIVLHAQVNESSDFSIKENVIYIFYTTQTLEAKY
jgi:hypothetical protein